MVHCHTTCNHYLCNTIKIYITLTCNQVKKIHQLKTNHEYAKRCIRNSLPQIVNDTPKCLTDKFETHSLEGFGNYAKQYMLKSYNVTCIIENCYIYSRQTDS